MLALRAPKGWPRSSVTPICRRDVGVPIAPAESTAVDVLEVSAAGYHEHFDRRASDVQRSI